MRSKLVITPARSALLASRAQGFRHAPTDSEARLWAALSGKALGVGFRRQVPIGRYIVDFLAPSVRLVVEVDGECHQRRRAADARRDRFLVRQGYRILRIEAQVVIRDLPKAVELVQAAVAELRARQGG